VSLLIEDHLAKKPEKPEKSAKGRKP
jgi:hypothetical protein